MPGGIVDVPVGSDLAQVVVAKRQNHSFVINSSYLLRVKVIDVSHILVG
jgi:hypothetical protein